MSKDQDIGYPMEILVGQFLQHSLPQAKVVHEPFMLETISGNTMPDYLVEITGSARQVFLDVTVSG